MVRGKTQARAEFWCLWMMRKHGIAWVLEEHNVITHWEKKWCERVAQAKILLCIYRPGGIKNFRDYYFKYQVVAP